jgi:hypothetical protein
MEFSEKLDQLFTDTFSELMELSSFQQSTVIGYNLIEEKHEAHLKYLEEQIPLSDRGKKLTMLDRIRREVKIRQVHSIGEKKDVYVNTINKSIIIYACSVFDFFLNEIFRYLLIGNLQKLASEKKAIQYHELILNSKEAIIESLIEKEIHEVSYKRIDVRIKYLSDTFDLDLEFTNDETYFFSNKVNLNKINWAYSIRNIIVHNKGIINKIFLDSNPHTNYLSGEALLINEQLIDDIKTILIKTSSSISKQVEMRYY